MPNSQPLKKFRVGVKPLKGSKQGRLFEFCVEEPSERCVRNFFFNTQPHLYLDSITEI